MPNRNILLLLFVAALSCRVRGQLTSAAALQIAQSDNNDHLQYVLSNILRPRVVGTRSHDEVAAFIYGELQTLGCDMEVDTFTESTPIFKNLTFTNIIGTINSDAAEFIALSCHYDTKYFADNPGFLGATDSAVPCALILNLVKVLAPYIDKIRGRNDFGVKLIFFDGEEAFKSWTRDDSVYGSRHLAEKWARTPYQRPGTQELIRNIDRIELLVLLDLIGGQNPKFNNFQPRAHALHDQLATIERSLAKSGALNTKRFMFYPGVTKGFIDDDHRHFHEQNVPILHIISNPFPKQWHSKNDDAEHLHWPTIHDFNRIFRVFFYQYITSRGGSLNLRSI